VGIYDNKISFDFASLTKKAFPFVLAIIVIIGVFLLLSTITEMAKPKTISASLSDNPLDTAKDSFTKLTVTITNTTAKNAPVVVVEVLPEDSEAIIVSPKQADLGLIEKGNERTTEFIVRPNPGKTVLSGTYSINVFAVMNGERFRETVLLKIKTG